MNPMEFHRYGTRPSFPSKVHELMAPVDALKTQLATRLLHHAFQEIEIKPFTIHPSSFILFTMLGSTLSNDQLPDKRFDFPFVNPPYGFEWSKDFDVVTMAGFVLANGCMEATAN